MTSPMPRPGERVGPYRLLEVAGEGGMGVVYRAADTALHDRIVAVKVMAAHLSAEPAYRAAFLHEAHVAAEVSHPHVVPVHAAGEADGLLYMAMAWVEGRDLRVLSSLGDLSAARAVVIVRQIARALDAVHDAGIVHGDVKPSNVLVHREDGEDHAYLLDFGVARRTEYADPRTNELVGGTPAYAAPETASGPPDPATDRYSLGCVVFELLTGERPFGSGNAAVLARRHVESPRPRVSDVVPELVSFDEVVARAMARDPADRYPSGAEFGRALDRAQRASDEPTTLVMLPRRREPTPPARDDAAQGQDQAEASRDEGWGDRDDARRDGGGRRDEEWAGLARAPVERDPTPTPARRPRTPKPAAPSTRLRPLPAKRVRADATPPPRRQGPSAVAIVAFAVLLVAAAVIGYLVFGPKDDLAQRQADADRVVVTRLVSHYATALKDADAELLARTVSPDVVRDATDGNEQPRCVTDEGSRKAIARWSDLWQSVEDYRLTGVKVRLDGDTATIDAQSRARGVEPSPIRLNARLEDNVWRLTKVVSAPCDS